MAGRPADGRSTPVPEDSMTLNERLRGIGAALAIILLTGAAAQASAPLQKAQAPGYYRMMLGDFEVTALSDGTLSMKVGDLLTHITPKEINDGLARSFLKDPVDTSVNGFLINTGTKLVLIDTGAGTLFGPTLGKLVANLKASGYQPEQVGGLSVDGKTIFPNAVVRASQMEADYWLSQAHMDAAAKDAKEGYQTAMTALNPYISAKRFKPFRGDVELVPGIRAMAAPGHTAGHTVYVVESNEQKLVLWGDLMHVAALQFADPNVIIRFDTDSAFALAQRKKVFAEAATHGYWVGGAHLSFPGIGHLRAAGSGYIYVPANYSVPH